MPCLVICRHGLPPQSGRPAAPAAAGPAQAARHDAGPAGRGHRCLAGARGRDRRPSWRRQPSADHAGAARAGRRPRDPRPGTRRRGGLAAAEGPLVSARLAAWMNGEFVGTWSVERGTHRFTYDTTWLQSPRRRALSLSLPITAARELRGEAVANYFDNLLPDNERIRERLMRRFRTGSTDAFALLEAIGRDCVGAVQLLPEDRAPEGFDRIDSEPLDEAQ